MGEATVHNKWGGESAVKEYFDYKSTVLIGQSFLFSTLVIEYVHNNNNNN